MISLWFNLKISLISKSPSPFTCHSVFNEFDFKSSVNKWFTDPSKHLTTVRATSQSLKTFKVVIASCKVCSQISATSCKAQQRGGANRTDKAFSRAFKFKISIEKLNQSPPLFFQQYPKTLRYSAGMWGHSRRISACSSVADCTLFPFILFSFQHVPTSTKGIW